MQRGTLAYFAVAFGFSWTLALALYIATQLGYTHPLLRVALLSVYMFGPALGALAAQRSRGEAVLAPLSATIKPNRWWLVGWLSPFAFAFAAGAVSLVFPGVSPALDFSGLLERLAPGLTPEQLAKASEQLHALPPAALLAVLVVQALIAGISINAIFAFGEELGWRGYLYARPLVSGFWKNALVVGAVWGAWHAPIILQGHNYPQHPVIGVFMMIAWCTLLAPSFAFIRERGGSVVAAAVLHGTLNASAGIALLFVRGGSDLVVGVTGLAGFVVLGVVNLAILRARKKLSAAA